MRKIYRFVDELNDLLDSLDARVTALEGQHKPTEKAEPKKEVLPWWKRMYPDPYA